MAVSLPRTPAAGPYRVWFTLPGRDGEQAFYFDERVARSEETLGLRLAALLDNQDPEGWVRIVTAPLAPRIDVRAALPDRSDDIDAALVMAEELPPPPSVGESGCEVPPPGGRVLFFGKVSPSLGVMLPVVVDYRNPWLTRPRRLRPPSFWPGFRPQNGPRQVGVRATPKRGSTVLTTWEDGQAAVVEQTVGAGRSVWIGAAPGRLWQHTSGLQGADELLLRTLYHVLGRPPPGRR